MAVLTRLRDCRRERRLNRRARSIVFAAQQDVQCANAMCGHTYEVHDEEYYGTVSMSACRSCPCGQFCEPLPSEAI